jgi:hypothetical protein
MPCIQRTHFFIDATSSIQRIHAWSCSTCPHSSVRGRVHYSEAGMTVELHRKTARRPTSSGSLIRPLPVTRRVSALVMSCDSALLPTRCVLRRNAALGYHQQSLSPAPNRRVGQIHSMWSSSSSLEMLRNNVVRKYHSEIESRRFQVSCKNYDSHWMFDTHLLRCRVTLISPMICLLELQATASFQYLTCSHQ